MASAEVDANFQVGIVGFGPGGQALAALLGQKGHRVVVFEKFPEPYGLPRMSTLDGEIARLLQHTSDPAVALIDSIPQTAVETYGIDGTRAGTIDWGSRRCGYPSHLSLHQPNIETAMTARLADYPDVDVRWGRTVTDFEEIADGVQVTAVGVDGITESVTCRYLVGMDGASSFVRERLGIEIDVIHEHNDRWVLTDYEVVDGPLPNGLGERIYVDMDLKVPYFYGPNGAGRCRTDVRLTEDEGGAIADDAEAGFRFMEERVGIPRHHVTQTRRVLYRFRSQMARSFRVGRSFIGGDAAHAMPPHMGQGACTAMRDAANLGWKLDFVLRGLADVSLLDTYESERLEHDAQYVYGSLGSWSMVTDADPTTAADRDAYMRSFDGPMDDIFIEPLRDGVLHRIDGDEYGQLAGELGPQGIIRQGETETLLDNVTGFGFQLVSTSPLDDVLGADRIEALDRLGVARVVIASEGDGAFADVDGTYADFFSSTDSVAFLARPDFYLFGIAADNDAALRLVDDLVAQLGRTPSRVTTT